MDIPLIEQVRIQAQMLVPIVKTLRAELGAETANALILKALGGIWREFGENWAKEVNASSNREKLETAWVTFAGGEALEYDAASADDGTHEVNVTGCRYAQLFEELGEPDLGFLLICSQDYPLFEGFTPDLELTRTQTIMQGATHCDFRFRPAAGGGGS